MVLFEQVMPYFSAEELDSLWPTDATSEAEYVERIAGVEGSKRELRNHRTRLKTPEDALDGYDGLVAEAYKIRELGLDGQVATIKHFGRAGTGNTQWNLPGNFANAIWLIADHEGPQTLRTSVLNAEYGHEPGRRLQAAGKGSRRPAGGTTEGASRHQVAGPDGASAAHLRKRTG